MPVQNFYKTKLVYRCSEIIREARDLILRDLVAYTNDPVRYMRRMRMLSNIAEYEYQLLEKIRNFESNDKSDYDIIDQINLEVQAISNINA